MKKLLLSLLASLASLSAFGAEGIAIPGGTVAEPYIINKPGAYYLAGDRVMTKSAYAAIQIQASDVTLDLNSHTLSYSIPLTGSSHGIVAYGGNVEVRNGSIVSVPYYAVNNTGGNGFRLIDVRISDSHGIYIKAQGSLVDRCTVTDSTAYAMHIDGWGSTVRNSEVYNVVRSGDLGGHGIILGAYIRVVDTQVSHTARDGIEAMAYDNTIERCHVSDGNLDGDLGSGGIYLADDNCTVRDNVVYRCRGSGIFISPYASNCMLDGNIINTTKAVNNLGGAGIWSKAADTHIRGSLGGGNDGSFISGTYKDAGQNMGN